jgi:hypothetical protein
MFSPLSGLSGPFPNWVGTFSPPKRKPPDDENGVRELGAQSLISHSSNERPKISEGNPCPPGNFWFCLSLVLSDG